MSICIEVTRIIYQIYKKLCYRIHEKPKGLDFSLSDRSVEKENKDAHYYSCTDPITLAKIKKFIKKEIGFETSKFLDIGCGKGLVLDYFSNCYFLRLDGLDYSRKYCKIAENNLKIKNVRNIKVFCSDAKDFVAYKDYNLFFMYNPFSKTVLRLTLDKIYAEHCDSEENIYLIYVFPIFHNTVVENEKFIQIRKIYSPLTMKYTHIYNINRKRKE